MKKVTYHDHLINCVKSRKLKMNSDFPIIDRK